MSEDIVTTFRDEILSIFDLKRLSVGHLPIDLGRLTGLSIPYMRVNHYLVKDMGGSDYHFGCLDFSGVLAIVAEARRFAMNLDLDLTGRYCYITLDQGYVEEGATLRNDGWHLDGLQGDEVQVKQPVDLQFLWSDCLPTEFASQGFDIAGLDLSTHNVFKWLDQKIDPTRIIQTEPLRVYAMNAYHAHRAVPAIERTYRRFLRVSYTHVPVTSTRMTINPSIDYSYRCHTTTGEIPSYLI